MATACTLVDGVVHPAHEETVSPEELVRAAMEAVAVARVAERGGGLAPVPAAFPLRPWPARSVRHRVPEEA